MARTLDKQIQQYLPFLGNEEKRSILSVIKSFISLRQKEPHLSETDYSDAFIEELDRRTAELERGTVKGNNWEEVKKRARSAKAS